LADAQDKQCFTLRHWYRTTPSLPSKNASTTLALMHIIVPLQLAYPTSYGATVHSATHRPLFSTLCLRATSPTVTVPIVPTHSKYPSHLLVREHSGPAGQCCLALPCPVGPSPHPAHSRRLSPGAAQALLPRPPKQTRRHVLHLLCRRTGSGCMVHLALPTRRSVTLITRQP